MNNNYTTYSLNDTFKANLYLAWSEEEYQLTKFEITADGEVLETIKTDLPLSADLKEAQALALEEIKYLYRV